ncbi:hypothetical protein [Sinorhizobium meliloti]|uniref:hypothetical protein n=1 Tax=Rhizobium meliloti TaxID=382 RepID=UPI000FD8A55B|nr:hypothetical protein [Sinorhizobium meliloti]RVO68369.1 hypothetical protein CN087_12910 [Sinorhizobium meliloti]
MNEPDLLIVNSKCIAIALDRLTAEERETILPYYRGLETYAACRPKMALTADVIDFDDYQRTRRVQEAVLEQRRSAIARTRKLHRQQERRLVLDEFGWGVYDDD